LHLLGDLGAQVEIPESTGVSDRAPLLPSVERDQLDAVLLLRRNELLLWNAEYKDVLLLLHEAVLVFSVLSY
jgi:hypothetical protein